MGVFVPRRFLVCAVAVLSAVVIVVSVFGQSPPIIGAAPVRLSASTSTPAVGGTFTVDVSVDLTATTGVAAGTTIPAALSAFRIPITFDNTRVQLVSIAAGQNPTFSTAGFDATPVGTANAGGKLTITAVATSSPAPAGVVSVATLTFSATAVGNATISATNGVSLSSAIDVSAATLYGPTAISPSLIGGGVAVQGPPALKVVVQAGPSPVASGAQLLYYIHVENTGGATAHATIVAVSIPPGTNFSAASNSGISNGSAVQWSARDLAAGAAFEATVAFNVTSAGGTTVSGAPVTATATEVSGSSLPVSVQVSNASPALKPGTILAAASYGGDTIYDVTSGSATFFARVPSNGWLGPLLITPTGRLLAATNAFGGCLVDATVGGDLTSATPIVQGLGGASGIAMDPSSNVYVVGSAANAQIRIVAPSGAVTLLPPALQYPSGLLVAGGFLYVAEGMTGSVKRIDLTSYAITTFASGLPAGTDHFSGQLVRNSHGRLFVLWGDNATNLGLYDITAGGNFSAASPVTARGAFRVDLNQLAIDANDNIYFAGNGTGAIWRSVYSGGTYSAPAVFAGVPGDNESMAIFTSPSPMPMLSLSAAASQSVATAGQPLAYTLKYANVGGATASNTTLTATLPEGVSFVSASDGGTATGNQVTWPLGFVTAASAGTRSITVTVTAAPGSVLAATSSTLTAFSVAPATASLPVLNVVAPPNAQISVTPSTTSAAVNSYLTYTIVYSNTGGSAAVTTVLQDALPSNTTFVQASMGGTYDSTTGNVRWNLATLVPGQGGALSFTVQVGGSAGGTISNSSCSISAANMPAVSAAAAAVSVTVASPLTVSIVAAPSPVVRGTQINAVVQYRNSGASATNVVIKVPLPADATFLSATSGGTSDGSGVSFALPSLAGGASGTVRCSFRTNAAADTQFAVIATIASAEHADAQSVPSIVAARTSPTPLVPGVILSANAIDPRVNWATTSNPQMAHYLWNLPNSTMTFWINARWSGALYIGSNGHVYEVTDANLGSLLDLTAGGDYSGATPIVSNLGFYVNGLTGDDAGNIYCVSQVADAKIRKITPEGDVSILPPTLQYPGSLIRVGNSLIVSEGATGSVSKVNLDTYAVTTIASGFPPATGFFSGGLVYTPQGHLYVLWGNSSTGWAYGIFDITNGGTYPTLSPVTATGYYGIDVNQLAADGDGSIYLAGDAYAWIWRAVYANGTYGPMQHYWASDGDIESVAIVPSYRLSVAASALASANPGDTLSFTFNYRNDTPVSAGHVSLDVPIPPGFSLTTMTSGGTVQSGVVHWDLGTLVPSTTGTITITGTVTAPAGSSVTASGYSISGDDRPTAVGPAVSVAVRRPLSIVAFAAPSQVLLGQTITYTLEYENVNAISATNVVIRDTVPAGTTFVSASGSGTIANGVITWTVPTVSAGATGEVSFVVAANAIPAVTNAAYSITCSELAPGSGPPVTTTVAPLPVKLQISGTATPSPVTSGTTLTYSFAYANSGVSTAASTALRDTIPSGTTFSSATAGGVLSGQTVVWQLGAVTPGENGTVSVSVTVNALGGTSITNSGYSISSGTQTVNGAVITTLVIAPAPPPPLIVSMTAAPQPVMTGAVLTYQISITNPSDTAATNVVVTDALPAGTSFVSATGGGTASDTAVQWNLGTVPPGGSIAFVLTVRVTAMPGAVISNSGATALTTGRSTGSSGVVQTTVTAPTASLRLGLSASAGTVNPGGSITYSFTATNDGPGSVANVQLADPLPPNTVFAAASTGAAVANGFVTWPLGTLAAGTSSTASLTVTASAPAGATIANSGSVLTGDGVAPVAGATVLTDVVALPPVYAATLATDLTAYVVPAVVHENATFTYSSGGIGVASGLTATLTTSNAAGTPVATSTQAIASIAVGATVPIPYDWNTTGAASATYSISLVVTDSAGATLLSRTTAVSVSAPDGANLTGTVVARNSPVHAGSYLQIHVTVANQNGIAYAPLPLEVDLLDPATLAVRKAVPLTLALNANSNAATDVAIPTGGLAIQDYKLWLTTSVGNGRLLATGAATVLPPLLTLTPSSLTIVAGSGGTLTAALSAAPSAAVIVSVVSSNPAVVGVPANVTIAAGSTSQAIPLQGVSVGGPVTITATLPQSLGGGSATSSAIVVMSGALTATLQVYQGESVSFGVTITNGGNTALTAAPFAIEIHDPQSGNLIDSLSLTASIAAGATYKTTLPYVTSNLAFQKYEARLVYTGLTPAALLATAQFEVLKPPPLRLDAALSGPARVLIWSSCSPGNSGVPCTPVPPPFLVQTLTTAHIPFVVVGEEHDFLVRMRTGSFSCAVIDQANPAEPKIAPEYLDDVHAGFGLLFIHSAHDAMPKLDPALATKFLGQLHGPTTLTLLATPFTAAGTLTLNGNGTVIALDGAKAAATTSSGDPAIAYNAYGRGNVVVVPFDLEQTPTSDVAKLILAAIGYVTRQLPAKLDARAVVPVQIALTTPPGGAVPVTLSISLPAGVSIIDARPPLTASTSPAWSATIDGNTTATFNLWLRVRDVIGTSTVSITASLTGGSPVVTKTVDLNVTADAPAIAASVAGDLSALKNAATANPDLKAVDDAIAQFSAIQAAGANPDPLAMVSRALAIIADLQSLTMDATAARTDADRLLLYWQSKVGA